ncbi:MAG: hypothetical protein LBS90_05075 [Oscillospiraceae bacterium]|jgi:hypothetical protein|nr:hypothetical protein [Oscillospiraceae bacterium]
MKNLRKNLGNRALATLLAFALVLTLFAGLGVPTATAAAEGYWNEQSFSGVTENDFATGGEVSTISTALGLAYFASLVNGGDTFAGKTVVLAADVDLGAHY